MTDCKLRSPFYAGITIVLALTCVAVESPADAKVKETFFGIHDGGISAGDVPLVTAGSIRLWDSGTTWRQIEVSPGEFDWSRLDDAVNTAQAKGLRPMIVLGQTPRFHARNPREAGYYGRGANSVPTLRSWKRYVGRIANRYDDGVDYQIWNEPNIKGFWAGSPSQMALLTATASQKITRVAGPGATVVGPSFPLRLGYQQAWFKAFWQQSIGGRNITRYVDAIAANFYPLEQAGPEAELPLIRVAEKSLPKAGRRKPLWNTEINFGLKSGGGGTAKHISSAMQASYVARTLILNANSGIRRLYWYAWNVGEIANTHLKTDDGRLTRAGRAWNVVSRWILGTSPGGCHQARSGRSEGLWTCVVRVGTDEYRRVYWKPSGEAVTVTTARSTRSWTNLRGETTAHRGQLHLSIGRLPVMVSSRR